MGSDRFMARSMGYEAAEEMRRLQERVAKLDVLAEARDSLRRCLAHSPRDWSLSKRDAWVYGVLLGWDEALPEVAARFGWDAETCARLEQYSAAFEALK